MERETIIYKGQKYHRYPESKRRQHRVYFWKHDKFKEPPVALHRQIYIDTYGSIPEGYQVHHKDGNTLNNDIENLEALSALEHCHKHPMSEEERKKRSEKGKIFNNLNKWQKEHPKEVHELALKNGEKSKDQFKKWREANPELYKIQLENSGRYLSTRQKLRYADKNGLQLADRLRLQLLCQ